MNPGLFNPLTLDLLICYPFFYIFHSKGSVIVSFEVLFKTPVTANDGVAKLRDAVNNNERLGNFTVEDLKIIQLVNPTTAASTEGSTGIPFETRARKVISQLKMTCILGSFCNHDIDGNKNIKKAIGLTIIIKKHIYRR